MKSKEMRALLFTAFVFVFVSLLICGAPRLIASSNDSSLLVYTGPVQAYLCSQPVSVNRCEGESPERRVGAESRQDETVCAAHLLTDAQTEAVADANGNVLGSVSYMRSVYQSFALGDGFA